jgi:hypothetical protein
MIDIYMTFFARYGMLCAFSLGAAIGVAAMVCEFYNGKKGFFNE